jgi:hypothetical protein
MPSSWHAPRMTIVMEDDMQQHEPKEPDEEPRRTSEPNPGPQPMQPPMDPPMEPPTTPGTEFEKQVPHQGNPPIAKPSR